MKIQVDDHLFPNGDHRVQAAATYEGVDYRFALHHRFAPRLVNGIAEPPPVARAWGDTLLWVMLNPSTADYRNDDMTSLRVSNFTKSWGYGAFMIVNIYPFRSPHPKALWEWLKTCKTNHPPICDNIDLIRQYMRDADDVIFAWGRTMFSTDPQRVAQMAWAQGHETMCLGKTKAGHPIHPMARGKHRIPDDAMPIPYTREHHESVTGGLILPID